MPERPTIAYLTSHYARASDTFIRGEVEQLRRLGHVVHTFSVRKPDASELVSEAVRREHAQTVFLLEAGPVRLVLAGLRTAVTAPGKFFDAMVSDPVWAGAGAAAPNTDETTTMSVPTRLIPRTRCRAGCRRLT